MQTIRITDLPKSRAVTETFLDGTLAVISRSGLHATERLLLANLPSLDAAPEGALLTAGNRSGCIALAAAARFPERALACHAFDLHHARAIQRTLAAHGAHPRFTHDREVHLCDETLADTLPDVASDQSAVAVHCTTSLPDGPFAAALFMSTPGTMTGELVLDQLEEIHERLVDGGLCLMACEASSAALFKQVRAIFGTLRVRFDKKGVCCCIAKKKGALARVRDFSATFPASLPGLEPCPLISLPGVFCHRRPDTGGLALAEVAARDLTPGQHVLDMGCGCGLVGILLARSQPDVRVTFIDAHARALFATRRNLESLGLLDRATLVLSDCGLPQSDACFDLFAGNPPYYSDFRIAELFIQTAYDTLKPGGVCLTVAKNARALQERQAACFGETEVVPRRGYGVVRSIRL
ncbi:MAG: methyltransferase [Kiritimatiellae bacterium]|jgi:16S rRNA (guanine1207-N2)-methyltransferase|nr:methyltransferase [Kiritimatiellia bacterium]MDD2349027.1 methyltransferase [Kiritimatiellia bacterium]MDD3585272.1 methyltransferase [Kiritimatiellia bacterium]